MFGQSTFSSSQIQMDSLIGGFSAQAGDLRSLIAMSAGSLGFSLTRSLASPLLSTLFRSTFVIRASSWGVALLGEVTAFRSMSHLLNAPLGENVSGRMAEGGGIFGKEWLGTLTDFLCLKGVGHFLSGENILLRQLSQSLGMVAGEISTERLHLREQTNQSLSQRFIHASVMSLAMEAGMELAARLTGGRLQYLQQGLEQQSQSFHSSDSENHFRQSEGLLQMASENGPPYPRSSVLFIENTRIEQNTAPRRTKQAPPTPREKIISILRGVYEPLPPGEVKQRGEALMARVANENPLHDYELDYELKQEESYFEVSDYPAAAQALGFAHILWKRERLKVQEKHFQDLHRQYLAQGGKAIPAPRLQGSALLLESVRGLLRRKSLLTGASLQVSSEYYGLLDLSVLRGGIREEHRGLRGLLNVLGALEVLYAGEGRVARVFLNRLEPADRTNFAELGWPNLRSNWEKYLRILKDASAFKEGLEGYRKFARRYTNGDMQVAYEMASSLLSGEEFRSLRWGKAIKLPVEKIEVYQGYLRSGNYQGFEGYQEFAKDYVNGSMEKAYMIASSLLSGEEFRSLRWGKAVKLPVEKIEVYQRYLRSGNYQGFKGYQEFAKSYVNGDMEKAHRIASVLMSAQEFRDLRWGKAVFLQVEKIEVYQRYLRSGNYQGFKGYQEFAKCYVNGSLQKAHGIASALLRAAEFRNLKWGKIILLPLNEINRAQIYLRENLSSGALLGRSGWERFSHFLGGRSLVTVRDIARALLKRKDWLKLGWYFDARRLPETWKHLQIYLREGLSAGTLIGRSGWESFSRFLGGRSLATARNLARVLLKKEDYLKLSWCLRPEHLSEESILQHLQQSEAVNWEEKYPGLLEHLRENAESEQTRRHEFISFLIRIACAEWDLVGSAQEREVTFIKRRALRWMKKLSGPEGMRFYSLGDEVREDEINAKEEGMETFTPEQAAMQAELKLELSAALSHLNEVEQRIFQGRILHELDWDELVDQEAIDAGSARIIYQQALTKLKTAMSGNFNGFV